MKPLRFGPCTPISLFLGGIATAVGAGFLFVSWHGDAAGLFWTGTALGVGGLALLGSWRTTVIDPTARRVRTRRGWFFISRLKEFAFEDFCAVAVARTPGSTPDFCVQLVADRIHSLPTQGRNGKAARARARRIAELLGLPLEEKAREVSSVPVL